MFTNRQILVLVGFFFQILAVLYQSNETVHWFKSKKYKKEKVIGNAGMTATQQIALAMKTWLISLILVVIGLTFQVIAEFV
jgi:hypothetical protein